MALNYARVCLALEKDSARVSARQVWRFDERRGEVWIETSGEHLRTRLGFRQIRRGAGSIDSIYPTWKRDEVKIDRAYTADKVTRNFREPREGKLRPVEDRGSRLVIVGVGHLRAE